MKILISESKNLPVTEQMLYMTTRIEVSLGDNQVIYGSGFYFSFCESGDKYIPAIVTNYHVLKGAKSLRISYRVSPIDSEFFENITHYLEIENPRDFIIRHPDEKIDLAIIVMGQIINEGIKKGFKPFYIINKKAQIPSEGNLDKIHIADTVIMVGYPNGLWDSLNNLPLSRKGSIATLPKYNYNGKSEFVIDLACLHGSSGSPVFWYDINYHKHINDEIEVKPKMFLLGILHEGPLINLYNEYSESNSVIEAPILNLGYIIKSSKLLDFEPILKTVSKNQTYKSETVVKRI